MPASAAALLARTPPGVWIVLAVLAAIGLVQLRARVVSPWRLTLVPALLALGSLASALRDFPAPADGPALAGWIAGAAAGLAAGRAWGGPRGATARADGRFLVPGSAVPLGLLLLVFVVRYVTGAALAVAPALAGQAAFAGAAGLAYGLPAGVFAARALRVRAARASGVHAPRAHEGGVPGPEPAGR